MDTNKTLREMIHLASDFKSIGYKIEPLTYRYDRQELTIVQLKAELDQLVRSLKVKVAEMEVLFKGL